MNSTRVRKAGEVYQVDPVATHTTDQKHRRYVLLHDCNGESGIATLAYTSTKDTERSRGAEAVVVHGSWMGIRNCGFSRRALVYTSRLIPIERHYLAASTGDTGHCWTTIQESLGRSLGLGKGTAAEGAKGSLRGTLVQVIAPIALMIHTSYGVLVTEPEYSKVRHYQILVPLYPDPSRLRSGDLVIEGESWMREIRLSGGKGASKLLAEPRLALSIFYKTEVSRPLPGVVDSVSLSAIESGLRKHFGL